MQRIRWALSALVFFVLSPGFLRAQVALKGSGSFLAAPLCRKWIEGYRLGHPEVKIQYEAKSSSDGVNQWMGRGSEFALSDSPLTSEEEKKIFRHPSLNLPVGSSAVVITYNLPGVLTGLKMTQDLLSEIFMGTVKKWNDPALVELNPGIRLPDMDILVLRRPEESSLHDLFPDFLAKTDPHWILKREKEKNLHWPAGQGVKGNDKIYEKMRKWPGVIAAVDFAFAQEKGLPAAAIRNEAGFFVPPSRESIRAASSDFLSLPEDFKVYLSGSRAANAYPLCSFTWLLMYQDLFKITHDHKRDGALVEFFKWVFSEGQKEELAAGVEPLPESFVPSVMQAVEKIQQ